MTPSTPNGKGPKRSASNGKTNGSKAAGTSGARNTHGSKAGGTSGARNGSGADAKEAVLELGKADLSELYRFWSGEASSTIPSSSDRLRTKVIDWMGESERVMERISDLGKRLGSILEVALNRPRYECTMTDFVGEKQLAYLSNYDLEASLAVLIRRGLLVSGTSNHLATHGARSFAVPVDVGDIILRGRRAARRGIFDTFTLRGYLDRLYDDPGSSKASSPSRLREMYKMYANEAAAVARIERLPEGLRDLVQKVVLEFGGLLPKGFFERMETELPHWNGRRWRKILEESLVGTVERLELTRYGISHNDETLVVFNEVALAWLRRVAVPGDPDAPHDSATLGVDLASNVSRFLGFIIEHNVRFTVRGEIFKTTEKRILQNLIPNPGRELERSEVLGFIFSFARQAELIESTGERTFALTSTGREWEMRELDEKLEALVQYSMDETNLGGEHHHQMHLRTIFMRLVKRIEPGVWYDIMYLPFLARNNYICGLDDGGALEDYYGQRNHGGTHAPMEDLQRMAWNLVGWVRKRLYLLGLIDLGYDSSDHPVAMRVTRIGARFFGMTDPGAARSMLGSLVVTPDFEVVLFPTEDDSELIHDLDRFCAREKLGHLKHFRIAEASVKRALSEGMSLARISETLEGHARTPVPQNVLYSVRDWARQAGLLFLSDSLVVRAEDAERIQAFVSDPGVRPYVRRQIDDKHVQLKSGPSAARLRSLLRDLDYLIELE